MLDAAVKRNNAGFLGPLDLKRTGLGKPVIGFFLLVAVVDFLPEQAVFIMDAVAEPRIIQGCQRIQKAGGQPSQAAVPQGRIGFLLPDLFQVDAHILQCRAAGIEYVQIG